jgi:hypothetical protein
MRLALAAILVLAASYAYSERLRFYGQGGVGPAPPAPCTPTGLDFTKTCDAVYKVQVIL